MRRNGLAVVLSGLTFLIGAGAFTAAALAQKGGGGATGRVATVDVVYAFNEFQRQKDLTEEMRAKRESLEAENASRRQRIDSLQATINAMDPTDPTYGEKTKQLLREQIEFKNWFDIVQADMQREIGIWTARIYQELIEAVGEVAESEGYDLVMYRDEFQLGGIDPDAIREQIRTRAVIYARQATDITTKALDKLNTKYRATPRKPMLQVGP